MIDQSTIDLPALIRQSVELRPSGSTLRGRCPFHKGQTETSLTVWPGSGRWQCWAGCGAGDAIAWIMKRDGVDFRETLATLALGEAAPVPPAPLRAPEPVAPPPAAWEEAAQRFTDTAFDHLYADEGARALSWLHAHYGLDSGTLTHAMLGYNPSDHWVDRASWGLPPQRYRDEHGHEQVRTQIWLPRGIVIPWSIVGKVWKVFIRRPIGEPKYYQIPGGSNALYRADALRPGFPAVLCEAALDALALRQEASDLAAAVASGTTGARALQWVMKLAQCSVVLLAFDNDAGGAAALSYWQDVLPNARVWRPYFDDPAAMCAAGSDLRAWLAAGLADT